MKFGIPLGALNAHFHLDAAEAAERLGFESVWMPEHLVLPVTMKGSPHPRRRPSAGSAHDAGLRRVHLPRVPRGPLPEPPPRNPRLQHRPPPPVRRGPRRPDTRRAQRWPGRVRDRRELARRGVGGRRARLPHPRADGSTKRWRSASNCGRNPRSSTTATSSTSMPWRSNRSRCRSRGHRSSSVARARPPSGEPPDPATAGSG